MAASLPHSGGAEGQCPLRSCPLQSDCVEMERLVPDLTVRMTGSEYAFDFRKQAGSSTKCSWAKCWLIISNYEFLTQHCCCEPWLEEASFPWPVLGCVCWRVSLTHSWLQDYPERVEQVVREHCLGSPILCAAPRSVLFLFYSIPACPWFQQTLTYYKYLLSCCPWLTSVCRMREQIPPQKDTLCKEINPKYRYSGCDFSCMPTCTR